VLRLTIKPDGTVEYYVNHQKAYKYYYYLAADGNSFMMYNVSPFGKWMLIEHSMTVNTLYTTVVSAMSRSVINENSYSNLFSDRSVIPHLDGQIQETYQIHSNEDSIRMDTTACVTNSVHSQYFNSGQCTIVRHRDGDTDGLFYTGTHFTENDQIVPELGGEVSGSGTGTAVEVANLQVLEGRLVMRSGKNVSEFTSKTHDLSRPGTLTTFEPTEQNQELPANHETVRIIGSALLDITLPAGANEGVSLRIINNASGLLTILQPHAKVMPQYCANFIFSNNQWMMI